MHRDVFCAESADVVNRFCILKSYLGVGTIDR